MVYYEIQGRYLCLFKEGFGPLHRVMEYEDKKCLGLFLLELKRHRETLLGDKQPRPAPPIQSTLREFFIASTLASFTPSPPSETPTASTTLSQTGRSPHPSGVILD